MNHYSCIFATSWHKISKEDTHKSEILRCLRCRSSGTKVESAIVPVGGRSLSQEYKTVAAVDNYKEGSK